MVTNSLYERNAVNREKNTILSEVLSVHDDHWNTIAETSHYVSYRNNVMGLPILGLCDNIKLMTPDMIKNYHTANYHGDNIKVVTAGGLDHKLIHEMCEQSFKNMRPTPPNLKGYQPVPAKFTPGKMWINEPKQGDTAYSIINFEAPGYDNPDYIGFVLLSNIIGETDTSAGFLSSLSPRVGFKAVGNRVNLLRNYAKYKCCYLPYKETGLFTLYLETPLEDAHDSDALLQAFIHDLQFSVARV